MVQRASSRALGFRKLAFLASLGICAYLGAGAGCTSEVRDFGNTGGSGGQGGINNTSSVEVASSSGNVNPMVCMPGQTQCNSDTILETCDESGQWTQATPCSLGCNYMLGTCTTINKISLGNAHSCALLSDGSVRCWGGAEYGQVGEGSAGSGAIVPKPTPVLNVANAIDLELGSEHTCAIASDGISSEVFTYCWGHNGFYKLGDGTLQNHAIPSQVQGLMVNSAGISLAGSHSCANSIDGTAYCWGSNQYGQIGDGSTADAKTPAQVKGLDSIISMSLADRHTCALLKDNALWCWGENYSGELGIGTSGMGSGKTSPVLVPVSNVFQVSLGAYSSHVLLADGTVLSWGSNTFGQLGNGTTQNQSKAVNVKGLSGVTMIAGGGLHACALLIDGRVNCWGSNDQGQLGNGAAGGSVSTPVEVLGISGAVGIAAGVRHTCAWFQDGTAMCWGQNDQGQLGNGNPGGSKAIPVSVVW